MSSPPAARNEGQRHRPSWIASGRRARVSSTRRPAPGGRPLGHHDRDREQTQDQREDLRGRPIHEPVGVDDAGQRVVAQQLDRAEVADRVEEDEERTGADGRCGLRQHHGAEHVRPAPPEQAGALLERRGQRREPRRHRQVHVGIGEQREHAATPRQNP